MTAALAIPDRVVCPACSAELRLTEPIPNAMRGVFAYVTCPSPECVRDLVLAVPVSETRALRLVMPETAHLEEKARAGTRTKIEVRRVAFPMAVAIGGFACAGGAAACAEGPGAFVYTMVAFFIAFLVLVGIARVGLRVDATLGAKKWIRSLPHASLGLAAPPKAYRS